MVAPQQARALALAASAYGRSPLLEQPLRLLDAAAGGALLGADAYAGFVRGEVPAALAVTLAEAAADDEAEAAALLVDLEELPNPDNAARRAAARRAHATTTTTETATAARRSG